MPSAVPQLSVSLGREQLWIGTNSDSVAPKTRQASQGCLANLIDLVAAPIFEVPSSHFLSLQQRKRASARQSRQQLVLPLVDNTQQTRPRCKQSHISIQRRFQ